MKKELQIAVNTEVEIAIQDINRELYSQSLNWKKLRSCTAEVTETPCYYVLMSYNTIVAAIDKRTDTLYDFLRFVYGYTSTSAQHISKFEKDYCAGKWGCAKRYTWRSV